MSGLRSDVLSCLLAGMMELDLLGFNENTQFFVCKHRDYGENGALDEIERQNAEQQVHAHAGNARVDRRAKLKDSVQIPAHAVHIERNDQEIVGEHTHARHRDRTDSTADDRHFAAFVCAVDQNSDDDKSGQHEKVCGFARTGGLGLCQMDQILDADHRDRRSDAENECSDQNDSARKIDLEKGRHERNRKFKIHHNGRDRRKYCGAGNFFCFCHNSFPFACSVFGLLTEGKQKPFGKLQRAHRRTEIHLFLSSGL